jgi:hypothetical protein
VPPPREAPRRTRSPRWTRSPKRCPMRCANASLFPRAWRPCKPSTSPPPEPP